MKTRNPYRRRTAPASSRKPSRKLATQDVRLSVEALIAFQQQLKDVFQRREQGNWFLFYLCGQLSNLERKTIEPMVLGLHGPAPQVIRALQIIIRLLASAHKHTSPQSGANCAPTTAPTHAALRPHRNPAVL